MDRTIGIIVLQGMFPAAVGVLPLAFLYRRIANVLFREMVLADKDPCSAGPLLRTASILPLLLAVAWFVALEIGDPDAVLKTASFPLALLAPAAHAVAGVLAIRAFNGRCRDWRWFGKRVLGELSRTTPASSAKTPEEQEREAEALMRAHP